MANIKNTKGVDISYANGNIDLSKVKKAGYDWVMIRCGYGSDIKSQDDNQFAANVEKAEKLGMPWGVYLFSYACSTSDAKSELAHIDRLLKEQARKGYYPTLPIAIDIEPSSYVSNKGGWTSSNLTNVATIILDGLKNLGYYPMIYTGYSELAMMNDHIRKDYDCWFAQWNSTPNLYKYNKMGMWQYGGETNYIDGPTIAGVGTIDKNYAYKDYPTIIKNGKYNKINGGNTSNNSSTNTNTNTNNEISAKKVIDTGYSLLNHDEHSGECDVMYWYGSFDDTINAVACCCAGQMYLFYKAGAFDLIPGGKVADCGSLCKNFYNAGQLYGPNEVKPGDLVIFSWSKTKSSYWPASSLGYNTLDHVELCVAVNNDGTITCIGANNGGKECDDFQLKTHYKSNISCCCRPKYGQSSSSNEIPSYNYNDKGNSSIVEIQTWLNNNYNASLSIDGQYGPLTKTALVKALQTELNKQFWAGLTVDGIYGNLTNNKIVNIQYGDFGNITKILQGLLICNGYSTNGFDGIFGNGTKSAVQSYQNSKGLYADGIAGKNTFSALCK